MFRSNGGNDTIIGTLRPQDVIELAPGDDGGRLPDDDGRQWRHHHDQRRPFGDAHWLPLASRADGAAFATTALTGTAGNDIITASKPAT